ncbi:MAG: hypothetical protein ACPHXR_08540 [Flavicella sp.]
MVSCVSIVCDGLGAYVTEYRIAIWDDLMVADLFKSTSETIKKPCKT